MRKILAPMTAVALALAAGAASAAEWTGTITEIDEVAGRIVVSDETRPDQQRVFAVSDENTVGPAMEELREGDKVSIFFADDQSESGQPVNAMTIERVAETGDAAMTGDTAQWEGAVEEVDQTAGTVTVDGQEFATGDTAVIGIGLDELEPGDRVRIVYHDPGTGTMELVEIARVE
jgi:Cu/Ag efflux protein CusF